ncbi:diguanylate cyclase [Halomonas sp. 3H]|uniref:sensor domain-containing diguanylate cyclase n=1 Tax=Halomonas sp. 3H TaxID=2952527 RepID=UPI0020B6A744|nr:diguanylate cyclase [Halomonas sp. 3H]
MKRLREAWQQWRVGAQGSRSSAGLGQLLRDHYPGAVMRLDHEGVVREVNPGFERHAGHAPEQLLGQRAVLIDIDPLHGEFARALAHCLATRQPWQGVLLCRRADGSLMHQSTVIQPLEERPGAPLQLLVMQRDVTGMRERGLQDRMLLSRLEGTLSRVPGVLFRLRQDAEGRLEFLYLSEGVKALPGLTPDLVMDSAERLLGRVLPEDRQRLVTSLTQSAVSLEPWHHEFRLGFTDGIRWLEGRAMPQRRREGDTLWDGLLIDITERKRVEQRVQRLVGTDMLTGALNRRAFFEQGEAVQARARRQGQRVPVAMLDLDHFKRLNDTYGHAAGDRALQAFAMTCRDCLRPYDLFARIGGEEFAVMLVDSEPHEAQAILERLRLAVAAIELDVEGQTIGFTVSLGLAILEPEASLDAVLALADQALYRAKHEGRNRICGPVEGASLASGTGPA